MTKNEMCEGYTSYIMKLLQTNKQIDVNKEKESILFTERVDKILYERSFGKGTYFPPFKDEKELVNTLNLVNKLICIWSKETH